MGQFYRKTKSRVSLIDTLSGRFIRDNRLPSQFIKKCRIKRIIGVNEKTAVDTDSFFIGFFGSFDWDLCHIFGKPASGEY
jgi:hypothetical protein